MILIVIFYWSQKTASTLHQKGDLNLEEQWQPKRLFALLGRQL
jgi:hypothetical protein